MKYDLYCLFSVKPNICTQRSVVLINIRAVHPIFDSLQKKKVSNSKAITGLNHEAGKWFIKKKSVYQPNSFRMIFMEKRSRR